MGLKLFLKNGTVVNCFEVEKISGDSWDNAKFKNSNSVVSSCFWYGLASSMGFTGDGSIEFEFDNGWKIKSIYDSINNIATVSVYDSDDISVRGISFTPIIDSCVILSVFNGYQGGGYTSGLMGAQLRSIPISMGRIEGVITDNKPCNYILQPQWSIPNSQYPNGTPNWYTATYIPSDMYDTPSIKQVFDGLYENRKESDPYGGNTSKRGGKGSQDDTSDPIAVPNLPTTSAMASGFISLYTPTNSEVDALASYMWSNTFLDSVKKFFANPSEAIINFGIMPVSIESFIDNDVKICGISSGLSMHRTATQFIQFDCGIINIEEYYAAYLDYSPYTKASIYCPFSGYHDISIDDVVEKTLSLKYNIDLLSGSFVAFVSSGDSVLYCWGGNMMTSLPTSQSNFGQTYLALTNLAINAGVSVATGGLTAPTTIAGVANLATGAMQSANNVIASKPTYEQGGGISSNIGLLGIKTPYLTIRRPSMAHPEDYRDFNGYPSNITIMLSEVEGFTQIERVHLDGLNCTDSEKKEIERLLTEGVIF